MEAGNDSVANGGEDERRDRGGDAHPDDLSNLELTPEVCSELLDHPSWASALKLYAETTRVAVALIDPDGRLVGTFHNPQPIWRLARGARPEWGTGCLFCLDPEGRCTAAADALRKNSVMLARDRAG